MLIKDKLILIIKLFCYADKAYERTCISVNHAGIPVSRSLQVRLCFPERAWTRQRDGMTAALQVESSRVVA